MRRHYSAFEYSVLELKDWRPSNCNRKLVLIKDHDLTITKTDGGFYFSFEHAAPQACRDALMDAFKTIAHDECTKFNGKTLKDIHYWQTEKEFRARSHYKFSDDYNDISVKMIDTHFAVYFFISNAHVSIPALKKFACFVYKVLGSIIDCLENDDFYVDSVFALQRYFPNVIVKLIYSY